MTGVSVARHAGPVALAPFVLVGLRAMRAIEDRQARISRFCKVDKYRTARSAGHGEADDHEERQAARN